MRKRKLSSLSIFFPALNDAKIIPYLVNRANEIASTIANRFEIIVVNDGSTDDTADVLQTLQKYYGNLQIVTHNVNQGYGAALQDGFKAAKMDYIFYTDGDGQYDPFEIVKLFQRMEGDVDVVNGKKVARSDPWLRKAIGDAYNFILHLIYDLPIEDVDCDFRLCKRSATRKIKLISTSGAICLEMVYKLSKSGAKFAEVEVNHYPRPYGLSEYFKFKNIFSTFKQQVHLYQQIKSES